MKKFIMLVMLATITKIGIGQSITLPYENTFDKYDDPSELTSEGWSFEEYTFSQIKKKTDTDNKYLYLQTDFTLSTGYNYYRNTISATISVKFSSSKNYLLSLDHKCYASVYETEFCKESNYDEIKPHENDGIYFCTANNATRVYHFNNITGAWLPLVLDINQLAAANDINIEDITGIRFQYESVYGYMWATLEYCKLDKNLSLDNISITQSSKVTSTHSVEYTYDDHGNRKKRLYHIINMGTKSAIVEPTEVEVNGESSKITVYPNPTQGKLKVKISGIDDETQCKITIFDGLGKVIKKKRFKGNGQSNIDLSSHENGMYIMNAELGGKTIRYKVIKE